MLLHLPLVLLELTQAPEQQPASHVKTVSFVQQQDSLKDINADLEPTTMDQLDVKHVNLDSTVLMEKRLQKLSVILPLDFDSIL